MGQEKRKTSSVMHRPPSRIRYEQSHPVVSFRVRRENYQQLKNLLVKSGESFGDFFKEALAIQQANTDKVYEQGRKKGYEEAKKLYQVTYFCSICGKTMEVTSPKAKEAVRQYMKEHGWGHVACQQGKR